jgi:mono/diheme cytochrome c family protein
MKTILKYKFLLSIAVFSIFTILSCNTTNQNKATTISLDSMNAIYTRDSINAIADYDTEFLGEPLKDSVMQHNRNVFVINGCAYCHGLYLKPAVGEAANLLNSMIVATDKNGELIKAVLKAGIPATAKTSPMPQFSDLSEKDMDALVSYIHYTKTEELKKLAAK